MGRLAKAAGSTVLVVTGLMAMAGGASGTILTSPAGTDFRADVHASAEGTVKLDGDVVVTCQQSTLDGVVANTGGAETKSKVPVVELTLEECGANTVTVIEPELFDPPGIIELHGTGNGNATVTSSRIEITVLTHNLLGTVHCIYRTEETDLGVFTSSSTTEATATLEIGTAPISQKTTDIGCGSESSLTGNYKFTSPDYLDADSDPTPLTSPAGSSLGIGTSLHAANEANITLDGTVNLICKKSTFEAQANESKEGGTVEGPVSKLTFEECGNNTVTVLSKGSFALHATGGGNGTITSTGAEITALTHNILGTVHCIYTTSATDLGTFTGSKTTGSTATWTIDSLPIPRKTTDFGCGETSELTGSYRFAGPDYLDLDNDLIPLTSPAGTDLEAGTQIHAANVGDTVLDGTVNLICKKSTFEAQANESKEGGTVEGPVSKLTFEECGNNTVTVLSKGSFALHATGGGNGTITSTGAEITALTHNILGTVHCIYTTSATDLGTFTGSKTTGSTATWTIDSLPIPRKTTDLGCGSTSELTAHYTFSSPDYLDIDGGKVAASTLTSPSGTNLEEGAAVHGINVGTIVMDGALHFTCKRSTLQGVGSKSKETETATLSLSTLTFEECGTATVTVIEPGTLELHATGGGNGTVTWTGAEITILTHSALGTNHCIYYTEDTDFGSIAGSKTGGSTATWVFNPESLLLRTTDMGCESTAELTGEYVITTPDYLDVD